MKFVLPLALIAFFIYQFFLGSVFAQTVTKPRFYCLGANCDTFITAEKKRESEEQQEQQNQQQQEQKTEENSTQQRSAIQFVDHRVSKVEGKDMSIKVKRTDNVQPGDIMIAVIGSDYAHVKKAPDGWTLIRQEVKNSGHKDDLAIQSYYKVVTSNEDKNYKFKMKTKRDDTPSKDQPLIAVDLYVFRGVNQNNPIVSSKTVGEDPDPAAIECPSVEGVSGGMLICGYIGDDPGSVTAPSSMTQTSNFEIKGGDTYAIAYESLTKEGETGSRIASWNNTENGKKSKKSKKKNEVKNGSDFGQAIVLRPN